MHGVCLLIGMPSAGGIVFPVFVSPPPPHEEGMMYLRSQRSKAICTRSRRMEASYCSWSMVHRAPQGVVQGIVRKPLFLPSSEPKAGECLHGESPPAGEGGQGREGLAESSSKAHEPGILGVWNHLTRQAFLNCGIQWDNTFLNLIP